MLAVCLVVNYNSTKCAKTVCEFFSSVWISAQALVRKFNIFLSALCVGRRCRRALRLFVLVSSVCVCVSLVLCFACAQFVFLRVKNWLSLPTLLLFFLLL